MSGEFESELDWLGEARRRLCAGGHERRDVVDYAVTLTAFDVGPPADHPRLRRCPRRQRDAPLHAQRRQATWHRLPRRYAWRGSPSCATRGEEGLGRDDRGMATMSDEPSPRPLLPSRWTRRSRSPSRKGRMLYPDGSLFVNAETTDLAAVLARAADDGQTVVLCYAGRDTPHRRGASSAERRLTTAHPSPRTTARHFPPPARSPESTSRSASQGSTPLRRPNCTPASPRARTTEHHDVYLEYLR